MPKEYTHQNLDEVIYSISGHYAIDKETSIMFNGKRLMYVIGNAKIDASCCGEGGCRYALIPGYILAWKETLNDKGEFITKVEPVKDKASRKEIFNILQKKEIITQIEFW